MRLLYWPILRYFGWRLGIRYHDRAAVPTHSSLQPRIMRPLLPSWLKDILPTAARLRMRDIAGIGLYRGFPDEHAAIFIHIPKSGGLSVKRSLGIARTGHADYVSFRAASPRKCREYFKFAFVRNPWDRLLSAYSFLKAGGIPRWDAGLNARLMDGVTGFEQFVLERLELPEVRNALHFQPQLRFISDESGMPKMDFVGRVETIEADFGFICTRLGISAPLQRLNQSSHPPYQSAYTPAMRDVAASVYARDIELFGYRFDG